MGSYIKKVAERVDRHIWPDLSQGQKRPSPDSVARTVAVFKERLEIPAKDREYRFVDMNVDSEKYAVYYHYRARKGVAELVGIYNGYSGYNHILEDLEFSAEQGIKGLG